MLFCATLMIYYDYSNIWPIIRVGAVFSGMHHMVFTTPVFWLGLFLIPVTALLLDVVIKV
jgi:phospholipid-transporting ATPase